MAELTRKAQIAAGAAITPLTPGEKLVKTLANPTDTKFIVTLTPADASSGAMDKTATEINEAYDAGKDIWFEVTDGASDFMAKVSQVTYDPTLSLPTFHAFIVTRDLLVEIVTGTNPEDAYMMFAYTLTPAT